MEAAVQIEDLRVVFPSIRLEVVRNNPQNHCVQLGMARLPLPQPMAQRDARAVQQFMASRMLHVMMQRQAEMLEEAEHGPGGTHHH